MLEILKSNR